MEYFEDAAFWVKQRLILNRTHCVLMLQLQHSLQTWFAGIQRNNSYRIGVPGNSIPILYVQCFFQSFKNSLK